ncbi:MAG TPA: histidinol-phosphate transaminase [Pyrinomonadaceae bacterium]|nr:histidinol-phosphate transaminase [Pyrinomonadaceae bacterium]
MKFDLENLVRENIKNLTPYSSARKEFNGAAQIFLDANENSFGSPLAQNYNRYPDPLQTKIKKEVAEWNDVKPNEIFVGNGSDEAIDLLFRIFCRPQIDNALICPPTYGMYEVSAEINDVKIKRADLTANFELDFERIKNAIDENTKLLFVCSPNNPTGNSFERENILELVKKFQGITVIDEAYIHFSGEKSLVSYINDFPNLVILQTFSKAWGLAGLRVGLAFANEETIKLFNLVKPPYNVSQIAQEAVLQALENKSQVEKTIAEIIAEREKLVENFRGFSFVTKIYPSKANFVLIKTTDAEGIYKFLLDEKIVVRNRNNVELCAGCLRITVGTNEENAALLNSLKNYETTDKHR